MAHATVGYCFEGDPENGGQGLLIALNRCQAFKVAQKASRGKGGVKVAKGDCLLTDCNVTGTDIGTPDKPKFALKDLWEYSLLPTLELWSDQVDSVKGPWSYIKRTMQV